MDYQFLLFHHQTIRKLVQQTIVTTPRSFVRWLDFKIVRLFVSLFVRYGFDFFFSEKKDRQTDRQIRRKTDRRKDQRNEKKVREIDPLLQNSKER